MGKSEQQQIKQLRAKVRELEQMVVAQQKLVEIMKSLPGIKEVKLTDETTKSKPRVLRRTKKEGGPVVKGGPPRESAASGKDTASDNQDAQVMDYQLQ